MSHWKIIRFDNVVDDEGCTINNCQQTVERKVIHEAVLPEVSKLNSSGRKKQREPMQFSPEEKYSAATL